MNPARECDVFYIKFLFALMKRTHVHCIVDERAFDVN